MIILLLLFRLSANFDGSDRVSGRSRSAAAHNDDDDAECGRSAVRYFFFFYISAHSTAKTETGAEVRRLKELKKKKNGGKRGINDTRARARNRSRAYNVYGRGRACASCGSWCTRARSRMFAGRLLARADAVARRLVAAGFWSVRVRVCVCVWQHPAAAVSRAGAVDCSRRLAWLGRPAGWLAGCYRTQK